MIKKSEKRIGHWSDCAIYNGPAFEPGPCDCGGLDLAAYDAYRAVTGLIPTPGSLACFVEDDVPPSAVHSENAPRVGVPALAAASDLPSSHDRVSRSAGADSMHFNDASEASVGYGKPLSSAQSVTGNVPPHNYSPDSSADDSTGE